MNVLIAGDSWGQGEHPRIEENLSILHGGLSQYLLDDGYVVKNISKNSASNTQIYTSIRHYLDGEHLKGGFRPDRIFVFQTTYTRDYRFRYDEDWQNITEVNALAKIWMARFYSRLSEISQQYYVPVSVIGALSDTPWLDDMQDQYLGVDLVCQSMVNLIVNNNHRVDSPIFSWYTKDSEDLVTDLKKNLPADKLEDLMHQIDLGVERQNLLQAYPEYFWPDGIHPNRYGHRILYDFLKHENCI